MQYLQITPGSIPHEPLSQSPFKAVVLSETMLDDEQRAAVSRWLVSSGCLYMMAWGEDCRAWQDAVNLTNLQDYDFGSVPDDKLIISTSHPGENIEDVFWFAKYTALHPCASLEQTLILQITAANAAGRGEELELMYAGT